MKKNASMSWRLIKDYLKHEKSQTRVMAGLVYNDKNERLDKPGEKFLWRHPYILRAK